MPPSRVELYSAAREELSLASDRAESSNKAFPADGEADFLKVLSGPELAPRYALVTQLLLKLVIPSADIRQLKDYPDAPSGFSARALAKNVVVPFDAEHDALLGGSADPYVSNPLRRDAIDEALLAEDSAGQWEALIRIFDDASDSPGQLREALISSLRAAKARQLTLAGFLRGGMELQARRAAGEEVTEARNELFQRRGPAFLKRILREGLNSDGGAQVGSQAEIPWVRVFSREHAPSAQEGWYLVYLFAADGTSAFLSLIQGVTHAGPGTLEAGANWARAILGDHPELAEPIRLRSKQGPGSRPDRYEKATLYAKRYEAGAVGDESTLLRELNEMIDLLLQLYGVESREEAPLSDNFSALTLDLALEAAAELKLRLQENVVASIVAALRGGKHVLLTGPPGTGKTSLAQAICGAAERAGLSFGTLLTTGTSDWTAADTVGGYWPSRTDTSTLEFRAGAVLTAIDGKKWAIIDELNRADIDKAIGQLFTTLSGQAVVLPYEEDVDGAHLPVSIVPPGVEAPVGTSPHRVPEQWRIIATLNTRDRDLLFTLSYALMRRFAVIDVPVPPKEEYLEIMKEKGDTGSRDANSRILALLELPHRQFGPAILIDVASLVRQRLSIVPDDVNGAVAAAILAYMLPQLDDLARPQQADVTAFLHQHVLKGWSALEVASVVAETFHASAEDLAPLEEMAEATAESLGATP